MKSKASFYVEFLSGNILYLIDNSLKTSSMSVTNDIENVIDDMNNLGFVGIGNPTRLFYRDTMGLVCEVLTSQNKFAFFGVNMTEDEFYHII